MAELHFGQNGIVFNQNTMIFKTVTKNMMVFLDFNESKGFYYASTCKYINKTKLGPKGENMLLHGKRYFLTIIS